MGRRSNSGPCYQDETAERNDSTTRVAVGERTVPFGINPAGTLVIVDEVAAGLACGCSCPGCGGALIARQGDVREHHFAHASLEAARRCSPESVEHRLAKQIIVNAVNAWLEGSGPQPMIRYECAREHRKDVPLSDAIHIVSDEQTWTGGRADVMMFDGSGEPLLAVEVYVTHKLSLGTRAAYHDDGIDVVEVTGHSICEQARSGKPLVLTDINLEPCSQCEAESVEVRGPGTGDEIAWERKSGQETLWIGDHGVSFQPGFGSRSGAHVFLGRKGAYPWAGPIENATDKDLIRRIAHCLTLIEASPHPTYTNWWIVAPTELDSLKGIFATEFEQIIGLGKHPRRIAV